MTDFFADADPADRVRNRMTPPQFVQVPTPPGRVIYARVLDAAFDFVGVVWMAESVEAVPRAGIVLAPERDPSAEFQEVFGPLTLEVSRNGEVDAWEWVRALSESWAGAGSFVVGDEGAAESLEALRRDLN